MARLRALIVHLPPESAWRQTTAQHWTEALEFQAATVELLHALIALTARAHSGGKTKLKPLRVPRPGDPPARKRPTMSWLDLARGAGSGEAR